MRGLATMARVVVCAAAEPPAVPDAAAARTMLEGITVAAEGPMRGYSREVFPHWNTSGECTTRETVLRRDDTGVVVDAQCRSTASSWYSPYDDRTVADPSGIDIDHVLSAPAPEV